MSVRVSVAMAAFNAGVYLREQVESIICQLSPEDELVISCDPSKDDTTEQARGFATLDPRVRVVENPRRGITGNFDHAIRNCSGEYIFLSDQDDQWIEGKVNAVLEVFNDPKVGLVIHNGYHTDENLDIIGEDLFATYRIGKGLIRNFIAPRYSGCCMAFRKSLKDIILPIPSRIDAYDHWIGMIGELRGEMYLMPDKLILHRLHDDNSTPKRKRPITRILSARARLITELMKRHPIRRKQ